MPPRVGKRVERRGGAGRDAEDEIQPTAATIAQTTTAIITNSAPGPSLVQLFFCPSQNRPIVAALAAIAISSATPPLKKRIAPRVEPIPNASSTTPARTSRTVSEIGTAD